MTKPLALCLEDLDAPPERRFLRCCALPEPESASGLRLDQDGAVIWQEDRPDRVSLFAASDDEAQLILCRGADTQPVGVLRAQRKLEVPALMKATLLDGDELHIAGRRLRVHIHGFVAEPRPPVFVKAAAKSVAVLATVLAVGCNDTESRHNDSPVPAATSTPSTMTSTSSDSPDAAARPAGSVAPTGSASSGDAADAGAPPAGSSAAPAASSVPKPAVKQRPWRKPPIRIRDDAPF